MIKKMDVKNRFVSFFDPKSGFYARTGILDKDGKDTGIDPFMASFPELLDIGIMETCVCSNKCKVDCYQKACDRTGANMNLADYENIMKQGQGKLFQCLKENEIVLKQNCSGDIGSVYISDIKVGDRLYCGNGKFAKVYEKRERIADAYRIGFAYGKSIVATSEHRFMTQSGLKQVKDMVEGDIILNIQNQDFPTYTQKIDVIKKIIELGFTEHYFIYDCEALINVCKANGIKCSPNNGIKISYALPYLDGIDYSNAYIGKERSPYRFKAIYKVTENLMKLLGHYVGNGCSRRYTVSNRQTKMISSIEKSLLNEFPEFPYTKKLTNDNKTCVIELCSTVLHKDLFDKLFQCRNLTGEKQLPNFIYSISNDMKKAFLAGYLCDGNIKICNDDGKYGNITFNTSSEKLYKDICVLLSTLGVDYSLLTEDGGQDKFSTNDCRIINHKRRFRIVVGNLKEIFKIIEIVNDHYNAKQFKDLVLSEHKSKYLRDRKPYIVNNIVKLSEPCRVVDINIDSKEHLFVTSHGIISHNCALGGAGDPDTHENFEEILKISAEYNIVPNFTTSGIAMTPEKAKLCKEYCGAVAVSEHFTDYTDKAIDMLLKAGVKTNIHYVLSNKTIDTAIERLENNSFKKGINAVVFLLYKPVGLGREDNVLSPDDPRVKKFFEVIDKNNFHHKVGFDSCSCAGIVNFTKSVDLDSVDFCEGGRFSAYIDAKMNMMPCSFANQNPAWFISLNDHSIKEAWESEIFDNFRYSLQNSCLGCKNRQSCAGGCPLVNQVTLCNRKERNFSQKG